MRNALPAMALLLLATGCDATDPYRRAELWRPNQANDTNLRAMVAVPADLALGVPETDGDGQQAARALDRERHDKTKPLPDSFIAKVVPVSGGNVASGAGN